MFNYSRLIFQCGESSASPVPLEVIYSMLPRSNYGSFLADHAAAVVILILAIFVPFMNLATAGYRYSNLVGATHKAAHVAAIAPAVTSQPAATPPIIGIDQSVPQTIKDYLALATGTTVNTTRWRINSRPIKPPAVVTNGPWNTKLAAPADAANIYTVEVNVVARVNPLVTFGGKSGFGIPGVTGPETCSVSAQEMVENINSLNQ